MSLFQRLVSLLETLASLVCMVFMVWLMVWLFVALVTKTGIPDLTALCT